MFFKGYISPEMQENWFHKINNDKNYYFIIEAQGNKIGLTNVKDIDYETQQGEGGIFIGKSEFRRGFAGVQAVMAMFDFAFDELGLQKILSRILTDNPQAVSFNKKWGFKLKNEKENLCQLTHTDYLIEKAKFEKMLLKFSASYCSTKTHDAI